MSKVPGGGQGLKKGAHVLYKTKGGGYWWCEAEVASVAMRGLSSLWVVLSVCCPQVHVHPIQHCLSANVPEGVVHGSCKLISGKSARLSLPRAL